MPNLIYAQLNAENVVIGISQLSGEVTHPQLIRLNDMSAAQLGDVYDDGAFTTPPVAEPETAEQGA